MTAPVLGQGSFTDTCNLPIEDRAFPRPEIKSFSVLWLVWLRICIPTSNPPADIIEALPSSTVTCAACKADMICAPKAAASPSIPYDVSNTRWPRNPLQAAAICACWSRLRLRGATMASSLILSRRSASAIFRSWAASFSFLEARSSAFDARSLAALASLRACAASIFKPVKILSFAFLRAVSLSEAMRCTTNSPATPTVIKIPPTTMHNGFHDQARLRAVMASGSSCQSFLNC